MTGELRRSFPTFSADPYGLRGGHRDRPGGHLAGHDDVWRRARRPPRYRRLLPCGRRDRRWPRALLCVL